MFIAARSLMLLIRVDKVLCALPLSRQYFIDASKRRVSCEEAITAITYIPVPKIFFEKKLASL